MTETAAERYRELTALATAAGKEMRKHERDSAEELGEKVAAGKQRTEESEKTRDELVVEVKQRWTAAMQVVWDERWLRSSGLPAADRKAPDASPSESRLAVHEAFENLRDAITKPRLPTGFLSRRKKS
ncbi:hypothetical protein E1161_02935 [Saccharopolyspora aridisoli]|uniref:Uncharacterized protein n=1 Tax=Saccharopolyspora aridisoli TaxID=2530385 RepID=A0A4R4UYN9_9PSEU|nr:hypothetical protein [Saccharopolyspora aridisoli]TDC95766.1 hypothetical protein E1161_02935 [Saccharopolyspora aridisoli]